MNTPNLDIKQLIRQLSSQCLEWRMEESQTGYQLVRVPSLDAIKAESIILKWLNQDSFE